MDLSDGGPFTASRDSCPGADAKFLAGFMAKNFVAGASHPGQMEREGVTSAPRKVHSGKQAAGVAAGGRTAAPSGAVSSHTVRCAGSAGHGATGAGGAGPGGGAPGCVASPPARAPPPPPRGGAAPGGAPHPAFPAGASLPGVFARADRRPPPPALYHLFLLP
ncbi:hypothetical protein [Escherichia coli]